MNVVGVKLLDQVGVKNVIIDHTSEKLDQMVVVNLYGVQYLGKVVTKTKKIQEKEIGSLENQVVRLATDVDLDTYKQKKVDSNKAFNIAKNKIIEYNLDMKLIDSYYSLDGNKLIFSFTSSDRIDFRELVKDLAKIFKTRIELRQIGSRDQAKKIGGLGPCGRPICCSSFLSEFVPVSIKMAKHQDLSLNPTKISGLCGKLMCCLKFEDDYYKEMKEKMPDINSYVDTPDGFGFVTKVDLLKCQLEVRLDGYDIVKEYHSDKIAVID